MSSNALQAGALALLALSAAMAMAEPGSTRREPISYVVTAPVGHIDNPVDAASIYENRRHGFVDDEEMVEIKAANLPEKQLPPPTIVPHSGYGPVQRVVSAMPERQPALSGEDAIFQQIEADQLRVQCLLDSSQQRCADVGIEALDAPPRSRRIIDRQIKTP